MKLPNTLVGSWENVPALARGLGLDPAAWHWKHEDTASLTFLQDDADPGGRWHNSFIVVADSLAEARRLLPLLANAGKTHGFHLMLPAPDTAADGPKTLTQLRAGLSGGQRPDIEGYRATSVTSGKWVQVHRAAAAALADCMESVPAPLPLRVGIAALENADYAAGDPQAAVFRPEQLEPDEDDIFPADILVAPRSLTISSVRQPAAVLDPMEGQDDHSGWSVALAPVDTAVVSPKGFDPYPGRGTATWIQAQGPAVIRGGEDGTVIGEVLRGRTPDELLLKRLRRFAYLDISSLAARTDPEAASALAALAVAGVPLLTGSSGPISPLLGGPLREKIAAFDSADTPIVREAKSIAMRRTALELFDPRVRWGHWASHFGMRESPQETVSAVLATRRPDRVAGALEQLNRQTWKAMEVVLVLHGVDVDPAVLEAFRRESRFPLTVRSAPGSALLGEVLNMGLEASSGHYFAKIDDDDWYAPDHIRDLVLARRHTNAVLVGNQVEFVYLEDLDITTRRPPEGERFTTHVAGGTMLISTADLRHLGGWRPVHRAVDRCLLQAVDSAGGAIYRSHGQNYVMHRYSETEGHGGHTWAADSETFVHHSIQQWDGFHLPPSFDGVPASYTPRGRSGSLKSVFSRAGSGPVLSPAEAAGP